MVYDQIYEQTQSALFTTFREFDKVPQGAHIGDRRRSNQRCRIHRPDREKAETA